MLSLAPSLSRSGFRYSGHCAAEVDVLYCSSVMGVVHVRAATMFTSAGDSAVVYEAEGLKVTAFRVDHGPIHPAVGYRFDYKGRSAVISGDTVKTTSVIAAAKNADMAKIGFVQNTQ